MAVTLYTKTGTDNAIAAAIAGLPSGGSGGSGSSSPSTSISIITPSASAGTNTTNINSALSTLAAGGGGRLVLGSGIWHHNGIAMPSGGKVELHGTSPEATTLYNDSTIASSITVAGVGGNGNRPYASSWAIRDLSVTTASIRSGQIGLKLSLSSMFSLSNVQVTNHDTSFYFDSCWEFLASHLLSQNFGAYAYRFFANSNNAGSTPTTFIDCHAITGTGSALVLEDAVNALTWIGGDILGTNTPFKILGSQTRAVSISGTNFEGNTGTDIQIGQSSGTPSYPGTVTISNTRHHHGGGTGNSNPQPIAIDHQTGGPVSVIGSYFSGYTTGINQSSLTGPLIWQGLSADSITNLVLAQPQSQTKVFTQTSGSVSPAGWTAADGTDGIGASGGMRPSGDAKIYAFNGFGPWAGLGNPGDFYFQGAGAAGSRIFMKTSSTVWSPVDSTNAGSSGGMTNPMTLAGDLIIGGTSGAANRLGGNTSVAKQFLTSTGTGTAANTPAWGTISVSDVAGATALQTQITGVNTQSGTSYTLQLTDAGKLIEMTNGASNSLIIPASTSVNFPIGTKLEVTQSGVGITSIVTTSGVTVRSQGALTIPAQYAVVRLVKRAANDWILTGSGSVATVPNTGGTGGTGGNSPSTGGGDSNTYPATNLIAAPAVQNASDLSAFAVNAATFVIDTVVSKSGGTSLKVTPDGSGAYPYVGPSLPKQWAPVTPGLQYTGFVSVRAATTTPRTVSAYIQWYDSSATLISTISSGSLVVSLTQGTWKQTYITATAPANAAYAAVLLETEATGLSTADVYNVDEFGITQGTSIVWSSSSSTQPGAATPASITNTGFSYTGAGWVVGTGESYTSNAGDKAIVYFTVATGGGTFSLRGLRDSSNNTVTVQIDSGTAVSVSQGGTTTPDAILYTTGTLAAGAHSATITVTVPDGSISGANLSNGSFIAPSGGSNTGGTGTGGSTTGPGSGTSTGSTGSTTTGNGAASTSNPSGYAPPSATQFPGYTQTIIEDFNKDANEGQYGNVYPGWNGYDGIVSDNSGTNWISSRISVKNGVMVMREQYTNPPTAGAFTPLVPNTGSWVAQKQLYGKYIVRFYSESIKGFKIAWLLWPTAPGEWKDGEVDFPEGPCNSTITSAVHEVDADPAENDYYDFGVKMAGTGWHTCMIEWEPGYVKCTLDGQSHTSTTNLRNGTNYNVVPHKNMRWDLQNETYTGYGSSSAGSIYVDWVAQYKKG